MKNRVGIYTLGCRVNQYESAAIAEQLKSYGFTVVKDGEKADFYIVNTCAVTAESERKSRQIARRMAKNAKAAVIGCASQLHSGAFDFDNVFYVGGSRDKQGVVDAIIKASEDGLDEKSVAVCPMQGAEYEKMSLTDASGVFSECRGYIKIEDGCNGKCSYCIIPKCRGNVRSRPFDEIVGEASALVRNGYKEIILTGIEVGAYNLAPLAKVIEAVSATEGLKRLRFGSLSPNVINESFLKAAAASAVFAPHIHLSLQSCCDSVLKGMMRPYRKSDIYKKVGLIRKYIPGCSLSADIIVGFPGESEEDYKETERAVAELSILHVHSFPYSEREGTPAAVMPGKVPVAVRRERNNRLIAACAKVKNEILASKIGTKETVLVEKKSGGFVYGHTAGFIEAATEDMGYEVGELVGFTVGRTDGNMLYGSTDNKEKVK